MGDDEFTEAKQRALTDRRFECQNCGICCSHKGRIQPSEDNMRELAIFLRISEWSFAIRYLQELYDPKLDAYVMAFCTNNPHDSSNGCIFHFGSFCAIYQSCRADLCNVFPFNHFELQTEQWNPRFIDDQGRSWCRGVGQGEPWSLERIRELKQRYTELGVGFKRHLEPGEE